MSVTLCLPEVSPDSEAEYDFLGEAGTTTLRLAWLDRPRVRIDDAYWNEFTPDVARAMAATMLALADAAEKRERP